MNEEIKSPFEIKEEKLNGPKIVAIGVGGGGGNMINHILKQKIDNNINLMVANTDCQALNASLAPCKIQLGIELTKGLGAGAKPEIGKSAALESAEKIKKYLQGADIVFIAAGLGGGTGTGAAPVIAKIAKEVGALTISVVTEPFRYEGKKRTKLAKQGLEALKLECDSIIVVYNERLKSTIDKSIGTENAYKLVDDVLSNAVIGISDTVLKTGVINADFADLKTIMQHKGMALMGIGKYKGKDAALEAVKLAMESPLLGNVSIDGAMGMLICVKMSPNYTLQELDNALSYIEEYAHEDADIIHSCIFNTCIEDEEMQDDEVSVILITTGIKWEEEDNNIKKYANNEIDEKLLDYEKVNTIRKVVGYVDRNQDLDEPSYIRLQRD